MSTSPPTPPSRTADNLAWRDHLLASLRDCGVQPAPRHAALRWVILIVVLAVILVLTLVVQTALKANLQTEGDRMVLVVATVLWYLFAVFVLARARNRFIRNAWQASARSAEEELQRRGARRPILYLRSFQLDERLGRPSWFEWFLGSAPLATAEQDLTKVLRKQGPAIAIGRPDERLPPLGAARFYVSHDRWQEKVADVTAEAQLVIWATGVTEGLRWEISHLVETVPPEKVILWAHPQLLRLGLRQREAEWARFRAALGGVFPKPLPETLGETQFIYYTSEWEPHPVAPPRRLVPWFSAIRAALRAVLLAKAEPSAAGVAADPRDYQFADLIGAAGPSVSWPRVAGFFVALAAAQLPAFVVSLAAAVERPFFIGDTLHFWVGRLVEIALVTAAGVAAFRYLRSSVAPLAAAAAAAAVWFVTNTARLLLPSAGAPYYPLGEIVASSFPETGRLFVSTLALLAGLAWATRRMAPRPYALWFGAMWAPAAVWLMWLYGVGSTATGGWEGVLSSLLGPVLFAAVLELAVRLTPAAQSGRRSSDHRHRGTDSMGERPA